MFGKIAAMRMSRRPTADVQEFRDPLPGSSKAATSMQSTTDAISALPVCAAASSL
jgi:hypothetical protein